MRINATVRLALAAATLAATSGCRGAARETLSDAVREIRVPESDGRPVMTDGIIQPGEWDDVTVVALADGSSLRLKRHRGHLFIGVAAGRPMCPVVDLYSSADGTRVLQLHRSAQMGERVLTAAAPDSTDPQWIWGRTSGWYCNESRWVRSLQDSLMRVEGMTWGDAFAIAGTPCEIVEFDILTAKLGGTRVRFRIDVMGENDELTTFPAGTSSKDPAGWATLILE